MLKLFNKAFKGLKLAKINGLFRNPLFYFGLSSFLLFGVMYSSCDSASTINGLDNSRVVFFNSFFNKPGSSDGNVLFSSQASAIPLETPDLKIMQDNTLCGVATPCVVSGKVLGDVFGSINQNKKDITNYDVQPGDTLQSIATAHNISLNTLLWANELSTSSKIKVGDTLAILPTDGILHIVKDKDTISAIATKYKANSDNIVAYNELANQNDIYIGDIVIVPGGKMPTPASSSTPIATKIPVANNFFIFPTQGKITQGLHYYNAIDIANKCGTPIYAVAGGTVQRAVGNNGWNSGMGNYITILHSNGTITYYGHLQSLRVSSGEQVLQGQPIGFIGNTGNVKGVTGCHLHFQVIGAKNPLSVYAVGASISYK